MVSHSSVTTNGASLARRTWVRAVVLFLGLGAVSAATDLYVETAIDPSGQLHITTKHKREIVPKKVPEQISFADAQVSPDGRAVGWLALYPNCCASYPVALKLVILHNGEQRSYGGSGLPISRWCFWAGGTRRPSSSRPRAEVWEFTMNCAISKTGNWPTSTTPTPILSRSRSRRDGSWPWIRVKAVTCPVTLA